MFAVGNQLRAGIVGQLVPDEHAATQWYLKAEKHFCPWAHLGLVKSYGATLNEERRQLKVAAHLITACRYAGHPSPCPSLLTTFSFFLFLFSFPFFFFCKGGDSNNRGTSLAPIF